MADDSQVTSFIEKAHEAIGEAPAPESDAPRVPFQTSLKLTREQENKMLAYAFSRKKDLENESGRTQTLSPTWWINSNPAANIGMASQGLLAAGDTFMGKRSRYDATFMNDVTWRYYTMGMNTIFRESNIPVPLSRRICRQTIAKAKNSFFGSDPWMSIEPAAGLAAPEEDDEKTLRIERFCQFKCEESESKEYLGRAIQQALILGECAVKTTYVVRDQIFDTEAICLADIDGQPIKDTGGNNITQDAKWNDVTDGVGNQARVLAADGQTAMPDAPIWIKMPLNRRQVFFEGARSEPIYYKDFLCPITASDVQMADCICHIYDKPVSVFVDLVVKRGLVGDTADGRADALHKMVELVQRLQDNSTQPKAAVNQDVRPGENFITAPASLNNAGPVAEFAEFYLWFDANGDGIAENIMLVADAKSEAPVYYDHVANVTTDGLRPIEIVRVNPVEGRWYGIGIMELFESYQNITDLLVNRWNYSQSKSGRVDFWDPSATLEGEANPNLRMNWGGTYTKKPGKKMDDILEVKYLNDIKFEQIKMMIEFFQQLAVNESGVANANDAQAAGLESSALATGINNIQSSGDELFRPMVADMTPSINRIISREVEVTLANMNDQEAFTFLNGDTMGIDKLTREDVQGLKFKVKIELTAYKNAQQVQLSAQAVALVEKFYLQPPAVQKYVAPFYRKQLRAIDPTCDVDQTIVVQPVDPNGGAEPMKPSLAVTAKLEMLNPEERQQVMEKVGVTESADDIASSPKPQPTSSGLSKPGAKPKKGGPPKAKLGDAGPGGSTPHPEQLSQAVFKKAG